MGQDVFISYSRVNLPFVERLDNFLTETGELLHGSIGNRCFRGIGGKMLLTTKYPGRKLS